MSIKYAHIELGGTMEAVIAYGVDEGKVLPVGVITFECGEIGVIHVNQDMRRQGIGTSLLKHADHVAGVSLIDDGMRTQDGSRFIKALGRKKAPFVKRVGKADVLKAIRGITWGYLLAPAEGMNEIVMPA